MNERIKELWEESTGATIPAEGFYSSASTYNIEKFAELIVRRTLEIVETHTEIFQSDEALAMVEHIKQSVKTDFGVGV